MKQREHQCILPDGEIESQTAIKFYELSGAEMQGLRIEKIELRHQRKIYHRIGSPKVSEQRLDKQLPLGRGGERRIIGGPQFLEKHRVILARPN
ncbi:MAG TPA: hypothetical protein VJV58_02470 [Bradyrhizobium sp.]|uniref:hypothetical protein n=1 Tax=Bradyrhizobium sp. TaxID=376 RepID=UPI002B4681A7|nr:hypothetical protein [Bradyrhizobium sp.]HKO69776.1 hypothetical protein [Bradyrhizobium sp.]